MTREKPVARTLVPVIGLHTLHHMTPPGINEVSLEVAE